MINSNMMLIGLLTMTWGSAAFIFMASWRLYTKASVSIWIPVIGICFLGLGFVVMAFVR